MSDQFKCEFAKQRKAEMLAQGACMKIGGKYNWKGQPERLVYLGVQWYSGIGTWHQFAKVDEPDKVWCEVREADLDSFEETVEPVEDLIVRKLASPSEIEVWNAAVEARKAEKKASKAKKETP